MTPAIASRPKVDASILRGRRSARFASSDNGLAGVRGSFVPIMAGARGNGKRPWQWQARGLTPGNAVLPRRGAPQPFGKRAHHGDGEIRRLMHEKEEILFGDGRDLAFGLGARARGPGRAVDQGHPPANSPGLLRLDNLGVAFDLDRARAHHVPFIALVAGGEDEVAALESHRRRARVGEKLVVDYRDRHPSALLILIVGDDMMVL